MSFSREKRRWKRHGLACPVRVLLDGREIARSRTENLSDGGCYVMVEPAPGAPDLACLLDDGAALTAELRIPRHTANSFLLEPHQLPVRLVRLDRPGNGDDPGLALAFNPPLPLQLP